MAKTRVQALRHRGHHMGARATRMPEGWAGGCRGRGTHLIYSGSGVFQVQEGGVEVVRHVCPAAEEDQGAGLIGQVPLVHFDLGFTLGVKENHWLESRVQSGPDIPASIPSPAGSLFNPGPQLCHRDLRPMWYHSHP